MITIYQSLLKKAIMRQRTASPLITLSTIDVLFPRKISLGFFLLLLWVIVWTCGMLQLRTYIITS